MMDIDVFELARNTVDLRSVIEGCFGKAKMVGGSLRWRFCPFCGDGGKQSHRFSMRPGTVKFKCFACGEHGSVVDFVSAYERIDPLEAAKKLLDGRSITYRQIDPAKQKAEQEKIDEVNRAIKEVINKLYKGLPERLVLNRDAASYLMKERLIDKASLVKAINANMLAFLPTDPEEANTLIREICGDELLLASGIMKDVNKRMSLAYRPIVFFAVGGNAAEFRIARNPRDGEKKALRYGGGQQPWFVQGETDVCEVTEGVIDLLSSLTMGTTNHVMGLPSCNSYKLSWFKGLAKLGVKHFIIRLDNDAVKNPDADTHAGNEWSAILQGQLKELGISSEIDLSPVGDLNDLLRVYREQNQKAYA